MKKQPNSFVRNILKNGEKVLVGETVYVRLTKGRGAGTLVRLDKWGEVE